MGVIGGNFLGLHTTPWIDFLAAFGAVLLTFLAGRRDRPRVAAPAPASQPGDRRDQLRRSVRGGVRRRLLRPRLGPPGLGDRRPRPVDDLGRRRLRRDDRVGPRRQEIGKLILAACFVTDLGTVLFLGLLFADVSPLLVGFAAATAVAVVLVPRLTRLLVRRVPGRVSEPEIKFLFLVLFLLGGLAQVAGSEAVLPAYLIGLAVAGVFVADRVLVHRMRATAFSLLTPFYFLKAGSLVSLPAIVAGAGLIALFLAVKVGAKVIGVWPTARAFGLPTRDANYTTLLMSTGPDVRHDRRPVRA